MLARTEILDWLGHRLGLLRLERNPIVSFAKALELSQGGLDFAATYGKQNITAFVGFVDLVGFSDHVKGWSNENIASFLRPYLVKLVDVVTDHRGIVDKTIGDEVMFVLPDTFENGSGTCFLLMGQFLGRLCEIPLELGVDYRMRLGLAYGSVFIDVVESGGYRETTTVGEVVNLAKRVQRLAGLRRDCGLGGAFGVLLREPKSAAEFRSILNIVAGWHSRISNEDLGERDDLRGVSPARCALLHPKPTCHWSTHESLPE